MNNQISQQSSLQTQRFYKVKNPKKKFICALCTAPRQLKYTKNLSGINYLQIILVSIALSWIMFPLMGVKSLCLIFPVWMLVEIGNKLLYRKNIPCPYCGFDATWYRRDVKVANKMVKDFWQKNHPEIVEKNINAESVGNNDTRTKAEFKQKVEGEPSIEKKPENNDEKNEARSYSAVI